MSGSLCSLYYTCLQMYSNIRIVYKSAINNDILKILNTKQVYNYILHVNQNGPKHVNFIVHTHFQFRYALSNLHNRVKDQYSDLSQFGRVFYKTESVNSIILYLIYITWLRGVYQQYTTRIPRYRPEAKPRADIEV